MESIIFIIIISIIILTVTWRNSGGNSENSIEQKREMDATATKTTTQNIILDALKTIGCQPVVDKDNSIAVSYQGENFHIECSGILARVWDPSWSAIKADDQDLPKVREAINAANFTFGPTVVMSDSDKDGNILVHTLRDIMVHPSFPDTPNYIKSVLDSFFPIKDAVREQYQQIDAMQKEKEHRKQRPIGFTASYTTDE